MEATYPILPLRDIVVFPHMIVPLFVGRDKSIEALENVMREDGQILLVAQTDPGIDEPTPETVYDVGTVATVLQLLKLPDGTVKVLVEGVQRAKITRFLDREEFLEAKAKLVDEPTNDAREVEALSRSVISQFEHYVKLSRKVPPEVITSVNQIDEPSHLADTVASHLALKISDKQELLAIFDVEARLERVYAFMEGEIGVMQAEKKIRGRVKRQMEKTQREYYLNEQMKAIQKELGDAEDAKDEITELVDRIKTTKLSKEAREKCDAEVKKLRGMSPMSAEATVVRNYLDWVLGVPWGKKSRINKDIKRAEKILDDDHYGLEKVKERIIEYLAVQQRATKMKGPILCLVGPPGVGKTSLGRSIARATSREFVRFSLGGVRDEAEIRGHRRTYIGSMPGKIMQSLKKAGTVNPLFLLDEIDKMGQDFRGDPASALLEVLDPEQNNRFNDHYMEVDYDLSNVMFVTTANTTRLPRALLDRMEVIHLPGYTEDEKVEIGRRHLIPKQVKAHGLKSNEWSISPAALRDLIRYYTREAGVRNLERNLANLIRKAVKQIVEGSRTSLAISRNNLANYAGVRKFRYGVVEEEDQVGMATGLAWTEAGGELLTIEAVTVPGKGRIKCTGKLGEVMTESIQAAFSYVQSRCLEFGIKPTQFDHRDLHVHIPEGATPKDGPSAGVAMVTSIVSVLTGIPVRRDLAMTGEVTLRGLVLPIGGLKEKLLAALRGGIRTVLIPAENEKDLVEIPANLKKGLEIKSVATAMEVLGEALTQPLVKLDWPPDEETVAAISKSAESEADSNPITH
ncbi:MAG: endopeptidase La [Proteobacteria bacterium]|nr:endopeptidase La [Pseudomonadota bacterium]